MVGIPSTLVRFPTTWMEIHPLGLVGPDVAVYYKDLYNIITFCILVSELFLPLFTTNQLRKNAQAMKVQTLT